MANGGNPSNKNLQVIFLFLAGIVAHHHGAGYTAP
jgi:hypothetical protein